MGMLNIDKREVSKINRNGRINSSTVSSMSAIDGKDLVID